MGKDLLPSPHYPYPACFPIHSAARKMKCLRLTPTFDPQVQVVHAAAAPRVLVLRANALANECKVADWWIANWKGSADGCVEGYGLCDGEEREGGFG